MGQAPSIAELPPEWDDILANVTREEIVRSSRKKCRVEVSQSIHIKNKTERFHVMSIIFLHAIFVLKDKSVYLDDDLFDLDAHVPTALAILRAHPHLKDIRFKLVPGRMVEEVFWGGLFGILYASGVDIEELAGAIGDDYETGDEIDDTIEMGEEDALLLPPVAQSPSEQPNKTRNGRLGRMPIANLGMLTMFMCFPQKCVISFHVFLCCCTPCCTNP